MDWKKFFDSLGMNGTRWQWRIIKWQRQWEDRRAALLRRKKTITYRHKFCSECRALMDRDAAVCPHCGARAPSWRGQVVRRVFGLVAPSFVPISSIILGVNMLMFIAGALIFGPQHLMHPSLEAMVRMGALVPELFARGEIWRIVTAGYLHFGLIHLGFNMLVLSQVGPELEKEITGTRFFVLYTLALLGGSAAGILFRDHGVIAGASGALFGLMGFGVGYGHFQGGRTGIMLRNFYFRWACYAFVFGLIIGADNIGHLGGFVTGRAIGYIVEKERRARMNTENIWKVLAGILLLATVSALVMGSRYLLTG